MTSSNSVLLVAFCLVISINLILAFYNNPPFLRYEALSYLIKSLEITKGNFAPIKTHSLGLSLISTLFLYFFKSSSIFVNMIYAQFLSVFINGLTIFPFYALCKKILDQKTTLLALTIFTFSYWLRFSAVGFWTESLFTIFLLLSLVFLYKAKENQNFLLLASAFAALSYWVRPNGIIVLAILLFSLWFLRKDYKFKLYHFLLVVVVFFAVSAPFLYQRYLYFGSPFFYGENSKYWVDTYEQLWGKNYPAISFWQYLKNHSFLTLFDKFVIRGIGAIVFGYLAFSLPLTIFFLWGLFKKWREVNCTPLTVTLLIWVLAFAPIFHVFFTGRYLFPVIPIIVILTASGLMDIADKISKKFLFVSLILFLIVAFLGVALAYPSYYYQDNINYSKKLEVGRWIANNIRGKVAINEDWNFIMINLPDVQVGGQSMDQMIAPQSQLRTIYPGYFSSFDEAMSWFKDNDIDYIVINNNPKSVLPRLRILPQYERPRHWKKIYQKFDFETNWFTEIYKI